MQNIEISGEYYVKQTLHYRGRGSLITPFAYYRFLTLRYSSRRNPYTRNMFHELRVACEHLANSPNTPAFLRNALYRSITFVSGLAPVVTQ
ncbi:Transmembrane protein 33 [Portunus trituberculatus]|uniref:Transmembrane protein 33 n=1 Tax=Portunus trituberculatus TaxID=210409 RepID=A0A5B7IKA8_PORTR|nr:Transmembrane protein 33 [Portunus trituberculatus]